MTPRTWVILSDKRGDNGQVETIVDALGWPVEHKYVHMKPEWVLGKPRYRPSLDHLDLSRSDRLEGPWPDLIITVGRRPSMVALWVRQQSGNKTKIVLVGKPSGRMLDFALVIASAENQMPPLHNFQATRLPLMRIASEAVAEEANAWSARFADLPRPLIAMLIGGETNPFIMNQRVARELVSTARWITDSLGGTPYVTTSRRTTSEVLEVLRAELPEEAVYFEWSADAEENPYKALLGTADAFVVTGDSVSMMVEVLYLGKPLALFPLPGGLLGTLDQLRRSLAHWLFRPRKASMADRLRHALARGVHHVDIFKLLSVTRDFRAFHRMLIDEGLAVWAGQPFLKENAALPNDIEVVIERIVRLFPDADPSTGNAP
ncbi:MAG: ELM1/GtrOC1 family putative glycosyltransferase [Pseudomonadota bacterium]